MARKYLTPIDLTGLELTNFKVQNLATNPSPYGKGHTYYNTTSNELRAYNGTEWISVGGKVAYGNTASRPAAGHSGALYADTQTGTLYVDNGTTWDQIGINADDLATAISSAALTSTDGLSEGTTNLYYLDSRARSAIGVSENQGLSYNSSTGVLGVDYENLETQLITDGFATASSTTEFSNKSFSDSITVGGAVYVGGTTNHGLDVDGSGNTELGSTTGIALSANNDITLTSSNGDIVLNPDGAAYIGSVSANNQIATIGDVNADLYVKSVSSPLSVDGSGNLSINLSDYLTTSDASTTYQTQSGLDTAVGGLGYIKIGDVPSAYITAVDSNIFNVDSGTLQLNSVVNDINGEIHLKKNEYWIDGDQSGTQYGVVVANQYSGHFNVVSVGRDLELEAQSGNTIWLNTIGTVAATHNGDYNAFSVDVGSAVTTVRNLLETVNDDGYVTISSDGNNESLTFINAAQDSYVGSIKTDGTQFKIEGSSSGLVLTTTGNPITLSPDTDVRVNSALYVTNGNNAYVSGGVVAGGADYEYDGYLQVKDYNGNNVFTVTADGNSNGGQAIAEIKGQFNVYRPGPFGNNVGQFYGDGDDNLIVNAYQNNLVLQSDNSNSVYLGSVAADNKVVKFSDLTALSSGLSWKQAANLLYDASSPVLTGDTVTGPLVIDGHAALGTAEAGVYRVLITNSDNAGIYLYNVSGTTWTLDRATDGDVYSELIGAAIFIEEGTNYGATSWVQNNHYITDFTGQTWVQFSGQGTYIGSDSILIDGNQVSVILDSDSLEITSSGLKVNYLTNNGLDNDGGLYVKTGTGLVIDNSGNVAINTEVVARKFSQDLTYSGSATSSFTVTHNLGTKHVQISVFEVATGEDVIVDTSRPTNNTVQIDFAVAPASGEYTVVVVG